MPSTMFDERQFERNLSAARHARRFITGALRRWGEDVCVDDVCLAGTELVTNAVVHGSGEPKVVMVRRDDGLLLEVHDTSPELPIVHEIDPSGTTGFGLHLVAWASKSWGIRPLSSGKVVWCMFGGQRAPHG